MKLILTLIQILFLPLKYLVEIIYPKKPIVCYTWYTEKEYKKILETDKTGEVIPTYKKWKEYAKNRIQFYRDLNYIILVFEISIDDLLLWLKKSNLENITENREKYAQYLYKINIDNGFRLKDYTNYQKNNDLIG